MKRRSRMVQLDLFASIPPPPAEALASDPIVTAAQAVEQLHRRKRSEAGPVPFMTGPISHATGGPLSAEEAARVIRGKTIRCSGYRWSDGKAICLPCSKLLLAMPAGGRSILWGGDEYRGGLSCLRCELPIRP